MALTEFEKQGIIVGFSGGASTMQAVYEATLDGRLPHTKIVAAFSSNPKAGGLDKARKFQGLDPVRDVVFIDPSKPAYGKRIVSFLEEHKAQFGLFCQYGLEPKTPDVVLDWLYLRGKLGINQHGGAVNPDNWDFGGAGMSCAKRFHAARLMFVRETNRNPRQWVVAQGLGRDWDSGAVYRRGVVRILPTDTVDSLQDRAIGEEWAVQIAALQDFEKGVARTKAPIIDLVRFRERPLLTVVKKIAMALYDKDGNKINPPNLERVAAKCGVDLDYVHKLVGHLEPQK